MRNTKGGQGRVKPKGLAKPAKKFRARRGSGTALASVTWPATTIDFDMSGEQWMLRLGLVRAAVKAAGMDQTQFEKSFLRIRDDGILPETIENFSNARAFFEGVSAVLGSVDARFLAMAYRHDLTTPDEMAAARGFCLDVAARPDWRRATA